MGKLTKKDELNDTSLRTAVVIVDSSDNPVGATSNALDVNIKSGAGSGGTASADDADFTPGVTNGTPAQGVYESAPTSVTDGDLGTVGITATRALKTSTVLTVGTAEIGNVKNSGTFAVQEASASDIKTSLQLIDNAVDENYLNTNLNIAGVDVDGNSGNKSAQTLRVVLATDQPQLTAKLLTTEDNSSSIKTAVEGINTKLVTGTVIGDVNLGATDNAVLDSIVTNTNRVTITGSSQAKLDSADVTTAQVLVAAVADKKFYITSIIFSAAAAGSYWIEDDDAAQITCKWTLAASGGVSWSCPIDTPFKSTTVNKGLKVKGSVAGVIGCMITYYTAV